MAFSISHDIKQTGCNPKSCDQAYPYARMEVQKKTKKFVRLKLTDLESHSEFQVDTQQRSVGFANTSSTDRLATPGTRMTRAHVPK